MKANSIVLIMLISGFLILFSGCTKEDDMLFNNEKVLKSSASVNRVKSFYMDSYTKNQWNTIQPLTGDIFPISFVTGSSGKGPIICGGIDNRTLKYMPSYAANVWFSIPRAPFKVIDIAGENKYGPIVVGGEDGKQVAYMNSYAIGSWNYIGEEVPWPIKGLAGDNKYGPVVFGGVDNREIAYLTSYARPQWMTTELAPFPIKGISGNNKSGIVVFGGWGDDSTRVAYLSKYLEGWVEVRRAPVSIKKIAGNNTYGPIILGGEAGLEIWYMSKYSSQIWTKVRNVPMMEVADITGNNKYGPIVVGNEFN